MTLKYFIAASVAFSKLYLSSISSFIMSQNLLPVSGMNCHIPQALASDRASFFNQLSATAKYLKSSGIHASLSFFSMTGK
jgi:hypothetical protein